MIVNPYHIHIHQIEYEDEKNFINGRHRSLSMQCIQQLYAVFSTSKSVQKPPKTKQKQSSICILTVESRPNYAKLKFGSIWHDGRTNKRGGGAGHSTYSCLLPPQTTRGPEYSISYNNSAPGNSVCRYRYDP